MKLFDVYPLFDVNIVRGKGCHVWDGKKAWYSFNGGVHFMGLYDQSITQSEKKIIDKEKKKNKNSSLSNSARNANNTISSSVRERHWPSLADIIICSYQQKEVSL